MAYTATTAKQFRQRAGSLSKKITEEFAAIHDGCNHQAATFIVAAADSPHPGRADYVCGGADDQVQFQAAIDAIVTDYDGRGNVLTTSGEFNTSAPIQLSKSVYLQGAGINTTKMLLADNSDCNMIEFICADAHDYFGGVSGFEMRGNKDNQASGSGIYIGCAHSDIVIKNNFIHRFKDNGIKVNHSDSWYDHINQNWLEFMGGDALVLTGTPEPYITTNTIKINDGKGVDISTGYGAKFTDNTIFQNGLHGMYMYNTFNVMLMGNSISESSTAASGTYDGVRIDSSEIVNILGNYIGTAPTKHCVSNINSSGVLVTTNTFTWGTSTPYTKTGAGSHIVRNNKNWTTENSGTQTLGAAETSMNVPHGLSVTPTDGDIMAIAAGDMLNTNKIRVGNYGATNFTLYADVAPGGAGTLYAFKAIVL